ncbi:hypothetical protein J8273_5811 [Carpediemonas membranifera]|uniref:SET domain-containing protein n=1 Tax=Carpediemonas membranifera TaxID=201153 RepID=A0A8J6BWU4_9EUKA|nr:hypothetical protein J8273_5811 [Carpediemonas membranifera]|eukprot:KAG9392781.1 hypothetical protein J8273_5811 [Carpediemonas membranifera]
MGPEVGDGVITQENIPHNTVIGIYCGKVIPEPRGTPEPGAPTTYLTRLKRPSKFAVDSAGLPVGCHKINDGSAFYNVVPATAYVHVKVEDKTKLLPVILYLADREIAKFEYLSIEYGEQYWRERKPMALYPFCLEKMLTEAEYDQIDEKEWTTSSSKTKTANLLPTLVTTPTEQYHLSRRGLRRAREHTPIIRRAADAFFYRKATTTITWLVDETDENSDAEYVPSDDSHLVACMA